LITERIPPSFKITIPFLTSETGSIVSVLNRLSAFHFFTFDLSKSRTHIYKLDS
jgi:hypothetical protein